jgi:hypothetical protein
MRRSTIPDWPRKVVQPASPTKQALAVAAQLVRLHGDRMVPFFQKIEAHDDEIQQRAEARRRAFTLVINNDRTDAKAGKGHGGRGFAA